MDMNLQSYNAADQSILINNSMTMSEIQRNHRTECRVNKACRILKKFDNKKISRYIMEDNTRKSESSIIRTSLSANRNRRTNTILKKKYDHSKNSTISNTRNHGPRQNMTIGTDAAKDHNISKS